MKTHFLLLSLTLAALALTHCAASDEARRKNIIETELADTTKTSQRSALDLLIHDNRNLPRIAGLDSILCEFIGMDSVVYLDDELWMSLRFSQRTFLGQCLAKKNKRLSHLQAQGSAHVWTARFSEDQRRLLLGLVPSNCIACDLPEAKVEFALTRKDTVYIPKLISEAQIWR